MTSRTCIKYMTTRPRPKRKQDYLQIGKNRCWHFNQVFQISLWQDNSLDTTSVCCQNLQFIFKQIVKQQDFNFYLHLSQNEICHFRFAKATSKFIARGFLQVYQNPTTFRSSTQMFQLIDYRHKNSKQLYICIRIHTSNLTQRH